MTLFKRLTLAFSLYGLVLVGITFGAQFILPDMVPLFYIGIAAVIAVVGAGLVAQFLAKDMTIALTKLAQILENMESGTVVEGLNVTRTDEIGQLADTINNMSSRDKAIRQANEDPLTGLANRRYLMQKLDGLMKAEKAATIFFIDLDGFKPINDTHGHDMGDEALKVVSERFGACVRDNDVLARIGGDEFVMMFNGLVDKDVLKARADKVLELINEPLWINDTRLKMGASIGISVSPDDGKEADELMNAADEAMYAAKQGGKNAYRFYS